VSTKHTSIWPAEPHTIAKIAMLQKYLFQWFSILGTSPSFRGKELWYIDGFAGPGEYTNYPIGSPNAALGVAAEAISAAGSRWGAGDVRCFFIEETKWTYEHLVCRLAQHPSHLRVHHETHYGPFVEGLARLRLVRPNPFSSDSPLFAFIDPFGATDVPFGAVRELLVRPSCEVLVNLDSDGASRIYRAGESASHVRHLDALFGDRSWEAELASARDQADAARRILRLYKGKLLGIPNIKYAFSFEMRKAAHVLDYHLVFATGHPLHVQRSTRRCERPSYTLCRDRAEVRGCGNLCTQRITLYQPEADAQDARDCRPYFDRLSRPEAAKGHIP
jgi:three-Cys-motif partner protein